MKDNVSYGVVEMGELMRVSVKSGTAQTPVTPRKHNHYFKPCPYKVIDVYRVEELFGITSPSIGHAIKKLLVAGGRGGGKDIKRDIQEVIDTLERWLEMRREDEEVAIDELTVDQ